MKIIELNTKEYEELVKKGLVEEEKKIPEEIPYQFNLSYIDNGLNEITQKELNKTINEIYDKINEIIDYLKSKGE